MLVVQQSCRHGSETGIPEEKVVCLEGQRQVAAIAPRAPCSGIKIQDGKQTNKVVSSRVRQVPGLRGQNQKVVEERREGCC